MGSPLTLNFTFIVDGKRTYADGDAPPILSSADGTFGVKRLDTGAIVIAAGTPMTRHSGDYQFVFNAPAPGLTYAWGVKAVPKIYSGGGAPADLSERQFEFTFTDPSTPPVQLPPTAGWKVIGLPTYRLIDTNEIRRHLRINGSVYNDDIEAFIDAATDYAESAMSVCLTAKTIAAVFEPGKPLTLPRGPLISIVSVTDSVSGLIASYDVKHCGHAVTVVPGRSPSGTTTIVYRAGFALPDGTESPAAVPAMIRQTIKMLVGTYVEARESTTDKPRTTVPHSVDDFFRRQSRAVGVG